MSALKSQRIVAIVDDDPGMLIALSNLLVAHGFRTSVFSSAEDWLDHGVDVAADCMLLDIHLSGMSGIELQQRLRASGSTLPIIFMTARDDEVTRAGALQTDCVSFLSKPFPAAELIKAIESAAAPMR